MNLTSAKLLSSEVAIFVVAVITLARQKNEVLKIVCFHEVRLAHLVNINIPRG